MAKTRNVYFNPNPLKHVTGDCTVRACCVVTGKSWDEVYRALCDIGFELKRMPNDRECVRTYLGNFGFTRTGISNKKGSKRPTVASFAASHKTGVYLLEVANHLVGLKDGKYYDLWDAGTKSLYGYLSGPNSEQGAAYGNH